MVSALTVTTLRGAPDAATERKKNNGSVLLDALLQEARSFGIQASLPLIFFFVKELKCAPIFS
jgi:hypothetical protein